MKITVRQPGISLKLRKNIGRSTIDGRVPVSARFQGQQREVELSPYLGEHGSVHVRKSVREPAGAFSITLTDQVNDAAQDSLYGLIEPMDVIEIRMTGDAYKSVEQLPIMMRGFVSEVRRTQAVQADGKPVRKITISGQDYGKIWQIYQIFSLPNAPEGWNLILDFPFFRRFGLTFNTMPAGQLVKEIVERILNPFLTSMGALAGEHQSPVTTLRTSGVQIRDGNVAPYGIGGYISGTIYALLNEYCDIGAWNELFIDDLEDGPTVVYRHNPFLSAGDGALIQPGATMPAITSITRSDVVMLDASRTDSNVANYFWVDAPLLTLAYGPFPRAMAYHGDPNSFYVQNYGNIDPRLYGMRKMTHSTQQWGSNQRYHGNGTPASPERDAEQSNAINWIDSRRKSLIAMNRDNVIFESGSMKLKGNESVRAGTYLRMKNGNMESMYYCVSVAHDFVPFQTYQTSVNFERGTGFIDRSKQESGVASPYWSELADQS